MRQSGCGGLEGVIGLIGAEAVEVGPLLIGLDLCWTSPPEQPAPARKTIIHVVSVKSKKLQLSDLQQRSVRWVAWVQCFSLFLQISSHFDHPNLEDGPRHRFVGMRVIVIELRMCTGEWTYAS